MNERQLVAELFQEFTSVYDAEQVQTEYLLGASSRPDIVVFSEDDELLLIGEAKTYSDIDSRWRAFDQLKHYESQSDSPFLGFFTGEIRYIFTDIEVSDSVLQTSAGTLPKNSTDLTPRRGFISYSEILFCYEHSKQLCRDSGTEISIEDFLQEIQRIAFAEEIDQEITAWKEEFPGQIQAIDDKILDELPFYNGVSSERDTESSRIIQAVLNGYSFSKTDDDIIGEFVSKISNFFDDQPSYGTPIASAKYLANRLDVGSNDRVLDPAMGWGNVLRELAKSNPAAEFQGIEINSRIAFTASVLNTISESDISIRVSDGISTPWEDASFKSAFDHVILDPPVGKWLSADELPQELTDWEGSNIEDVFVHAALNYLKEGGLLTAIVPLDLLSRPKSERLREELINDYHIESIIEVDEGSFYPSARSDLAVIQIRNEQDNTHQPTEFLILDWLNDSESAGFEPHVKQKSELEIAEISLKTLIPSKVFAENHVLNQLKETYSEFSSFGLVSSEFRRGIRLSTEQLSPEGDLQYLKISVVTGESDSPQFVAQTKVDNLATAGPSDLLISAAGSVDVVYVPEKEVVPHSNWVVVRFESEALARVYQGFFCTKLGTEYLESLATGTTIPHLSIATLNDIQVPDFTNHARLEEIVPELAKIEQLNHGRVDQDTSAQIQGLLLEGN